MAGEKLKVKIDKNGGVEMKIENGCGPACADKLKHISDVAGISLSATETLPEFYQQAVETSQTAETGL